MIPFYDSTDPAALVPPADFTHVAGYGTGRYTWPDATFERYDRYIKVAVFAGQPEQAKIARCLDIERFDATVQDAPAFVEARHQVHPHDALLYCSLSTVRDLLWEMTNVEVPWSLWLAWWWQRPTAPTAAQVLAELRDGFGVTLPPSRLWGCQWKPGGPFDSSVLYQRDNFTPGKK